MNVCDLDQIYLVPLDADTLADAFAHADDEHGIYRLSYDARGLPLVFENDLPVADVVEEVPGGCLVRIGCILNDTMRLAAFLSGRDGPATLASLEAACGRAEDVIRSLGAIEACRSKGRWRPIDEMLRPVSSAHLQQTNTQAMRAVALRRHGGREIGRRLAKAA